MVRHSANTCERKVGMSWIRSILGAGVRGGKKLVGSDLKGNQYFERIVEGSNHFRVFFFPRKVTSVMDLLPLSVFCR